MSSGNELVCVHSSYEQELWDRHQMRSVNICKRCGASWAIGELEPRIVIARIE